MIRLTFALRRKPGMSFEDFQAYWREVHGPLVASFSTTLGIRKYVQVHALQAPETEVPEGLRGRMAKPFDGVAELWYESLDAVYNNRSEAATAAAAALLEDETRFIDHPHSPGWWAYECPQINPTPETVVAKPDSPIVKLFYALRHPEDLGLDEVQRYWRIQHGPLVRRFGQAIRTLRYIQVHKLDDPLNDAFRRSRNVEEEDFFGHAELWYDSMTMRADTAEARRAAQALYEDEAKFIDFARSTSFLGKEHVFIDRT